MSAVIAENEQTEGIQLAVPGLGERLKSARLAHDMEINKLAARIHLTADTVDALERDDYAEMPARVFVRGYVRNYARTVDLPEESVLAQFDRQWPDETSPMKISPSPRLASDTNPGNNWPSLVTWLVALVLLVLFLVWWQGYLDHFINQWRNEAPEPAGQETFNGPASVGGESGLTPLPQVKPPLTKRAVEEQPVTSGGGQLALPPVAGSVQEPAGQQTGVVAQAPLLTDKITPLAEQAPASTQSDQAEITVTGGVVSAPDQTGRTLSISAPVASDAAPQAAASGISVRFTRDCWVDIRDSTRTFKLFGTMKKGTEHRLGGRPPYKLVLGNARSVELTVDGKPYDLTRHIEGNVARFTLNP